MERNRIIDGKYIGYFDDESLLPIKKGDIVLVKKGTKYHSMKDGDFHIAGKSYKVKVDHVLCGSQWVEGNKEIVKNSEVTWAGSGGYWHRVDINDVEKVKDIN